MSLWDPQNDHFLVKIWTNFLAIFADFSSLILTTYLTKKWPKSGHFWGPVPLARARARARGDKINFVLEMHRSLPCFDVTLGPPKWPLFGQNLDPFLGPLFRKNAWYCTMSDAKPCQKVDQKLAKKWSFLGFGTKSGKNRKKGSNSY